MRWRWVLSGGEGRSGAGMAGPRDYYRVLNDPMGLISLKERGWCEIELPETLFDIGFPGHYMRHVKSVSLTIPVVLGPYTGVNCTSATLPAQAVACCVRVQWITSRR